MMTFFSFFVLKCCENYYEWTNEWMNETKCDAYKLILRYKSFTPNNMKFKKKGKGYFWNFQSFSLEFFYIFYYKDLGYL